MMALFKIKRNAHVIAGISGALGNGKSTTAMILAKYDTIYTRSLLKIYRPEVDTSKIRFGIHHIIINQADPDSKAIYSPEEWNSYVVDEGEEFFVAAEASSARFRKIRASILRNRKKHPSFYWVFPDMFNMPLRALALFDVWFMKVDVDFADILIPSRVITLADKFDRQYIQKIAKWADKFRKYIRYHSAFVEGMRTPKIDENSPFWKNYIKKYFTYATIENEERFVNAKDKFFNELKDKIDKGIFIVNSKEDIRKIIEANLKNANQTVVDSITDEFWEWWKEESSKDLYTRIHSLASSKELTDTLGG